MPVSDEIKRLTNCKEDISKENIAIGRLKSTAALRAIDNTKAVFPIPGRAARITKSDFCQPEVKRSKAVKPDGIPTKPSSLSFKDSNCLMAFVTRLLMLS